MDFKEKLDAILRVKKMTIRRLGQVSGLKSTLEKAYYDNREPLPGTTAKFLIAMDISETWYETGEGPIFNSSKGTALRSAAKAGDVDRVDRLDSETEDAIRIILTANPDYILLHKKAFDQYEQSLTQFRAVQDKNETKYLDLVAANLELQKSYQELEKAFRNLMKVKGDKEV